MKKFTFNDIKEFCKAHYEEYMCEPETAIVFSFECPDFVRKTTFIDMAECVDAALDGKWVYDGYKTFGDNRYIFKLKRIA